VKRKAKQSGSGGRLRLTLLLATAAAFFLVPAVAASAATPVPVHVIIEGTGEGAVIGEEPFPGTPPINCHMPSQVGDVCDSETVVGEFNAILLTYEVGPTIATEFNPGWSSEGGFPIGCEEAIALYCSVVATGGPITIHAGFKEEPTPPSNVTPPTISGTAKVGKTLKGNAGTWKGGPETFTYQWLRCDESGASCAPIAGAESNEYTVTEEDIESTLRFEETATNGLGSASATSAQTAVVPKAGEGSGESSKAGEVYGEVEQETSLLESTCEEVFLGTFKAGVEETYENSCNVTATSTGAATSLTAADEGSEAVGRLVNGSYSLAQPLQVQGTDTEGLGGVSTGFGTVEPEHTLLNWAVPLSADLVQVDFKQLIKKHDPLHTGTYSKVITLTLKQTTP
jgi:hypothetical protein